MDSNRNSEPERDPETESWQFVSDLASYVASEGDEKVEKWDKLTDEYAFEGLGNGRFEFYPGSDPEMIDRDWDGYIVSSPDSDEVGAEKNLDQDIHSDVVRYMQEDDAVEKLVMLAELEDEYDHTWTSESTVKFGPTEENGVEISVPRLPEIASSYNQRNEEGLEEDERDMLREIASRNSSIIGLIDRTVYFQDSHVYVERDVEDDEKDTYFSQIDSAGEAVPLEEAIAQYQMIQEGPGKGSGREIFESVRKIFGRGDHEDYEVFMDSHNETVVLFDKRSVDLNTLDEEEAEEWLKRFEDEPVIDKIRDFYSNLI